MSANRRQFLAGVGTAAGLGLAGCVGNVGSPGTDGRPTASASFFVVGDVAANVAGDAAAVETLVPVGQHGHGWEPGPRVQGEVLESDLFVHVLNGFQPWADDVLRSLESDDADVETVEAAAGVDLLDLEEYDDEHDGEDEHHDEHTDTDGHDEERHDDHGDVDPHFWLDPTRLAHAVGNVREGLTRVDPDGADAYDASAGEYVEALEDLDAEFEAALNGAVRDTVLVAGHNSFRYLGDRYGFHVESLTGLSPDDRPSPRTISRAREVVEAHDIEHVLAPALESDRAASQLVEETAASEVLEVTAIPGAVEAWTDRDWGYLEIMREVNLPAFGEALGA